MLVPRSLSAARYLIRGAICLLLVVALWCPMPAAAALDKQIVTVAMQNGLLVATFTDRADDASLEAAVPELAALGVQAISLRGTPVRDMSPLSVLKQLKTLDICGTLVRSVAPLAGVASLKALNLQFLPIGDLTPLSGLTDLEILNLGGTEVRDLTPLKSCANWFWRSRKCPT